MKPEIKYTAAFMGANMKIRYVGHGAQMPFSIDEARHFDTRKEAAAALAKVGKHHRFGAYEKIAGRRVIVSKPMHMIAIGL